jgi:hypothetical protein
MSDKYDDYISFVNGNVGVYSIASVIYDSVGDRAKAMEYVEEVKKVFALPVESFKIDYDDGIPGFFYAVEFLEEYFD